MNNSRSNRAVALATMVTLIAAVAASGCQPDEEPPEIVEEVDETDDEADDDDSTESMSLETEDEAEAEPEETERRGVDGHRLSIDAETTRMAVGESADFSASVVTVDDADLVELDEPVYRWDVPDGWEVDGEGADVTVTASDEIATDSADIRVAIEDASGLEIRGGMPVVVE